MTSFSSTYRLANITITTEFHKFSLILEASPLPRPSDNIDADSARELLQALVSRLAIVELEKGRGLKN